MLTINKSENGVLKVEERSWVVLEDTPSGEKIFGVLHMPVGEGPFPAVAICHGFGGTKSGRFRLFVSLAERLSRNGIAVFRFDYRGSGDSEGDPFTVSFQDHVKDTLRALDYMKSHERIDTSRIGICGKSMGGAVAALAAHACADVKVLALLAPMYHARKWQQLLEDLGTSAGIPAKNFDLKEVPPHLLRYQGYPVSTSFVQQLFALNLEKPLKELEKRPLLIVEAGKDEVIGSDHIEGYMRSRAPHSDTKCILLEHSDHNFGYLPEQKKLLEETCDWMTQQLVGKK